MKIQQRTYHKKAEGGKRSAALHTLLRLQAICAEEAQPFYPGELVSIMVDGIIKQ